MNEEFKNRGDNFFIPNEGIDRMREVSGEAFRFYTLLCSVMENNGNCSVSAALNRGLKISEDDAAKLKDELGAHPVLDWQADGASAFSSGDAKLNNLLA